MAANKIDRINREIEKTREKITEYQRNGHLPKGRKRGFSRRRNRKRRKNGLHITGSGKRNGGRNEKPQSRPSRLRRNH